MVRISSFDSCWDSRRARIISWNLRRRLFSRDSSNDLTTCWVMVDAALPPVAGHRPTAEQIHGRRPDKGRRSRSPRAPRTSGSSAAMTALTMCLGMTENGHHRAPFAAAQDADRLAVAIQHPGLLLWPVVADPLQVGQLGIAAEIQEQGAEHEQPGRARRQQSSAAQLQRAKQPRRDRSPARRHRRHRQSGVLAAARGRASATSARIGVVHVDAQQVVFPVGPRAVAHPASVTAWGWVQLRASGRRAGDHDARRPIISVLTMRHNVATLPVPTEDQALPGRAQPLPSPRHIS